MKLIKLFEEFLEDKKFTLAINESLFDKIESLVKGKSAKGEIISKLLQTNAIKETGSVFGLWFLGGAEPGKDSMSNPIDYLQYTFDYSFESWSCTTDTQIKEPDLSPINSELTNTTKA